MCFNRVKNRPVKTDMRTRYFNYIYFLNIIKILVYFTQLLKTRRFSVDKFDCI